MPRSLPSLPVLLLVSLLASCTALDAPVAGPLPDVPPPQLGKEPVAAELDPGESHRYRLDVAPGRWVTVELVVREVSLDLRLVDAVGTPIARLRSPANWSTEVVDLITGDDGPVEVTVASPDGAARRGGYRLRIAEERQARADDAARRAARQRLRELRRPPPGTPPLSAESEEAILRELLEDDEIAWASDEAAGIYEHLGSLALGQRRLGEAEAAFRAGLARVAGADPLAVTAHLHLGLGNALARQSRFGEAREQFRSGVETARASGDRRALGLAVNLEALFLYRQGEVAAAPRGLEETLATLDPPDRFNALLNLALFLRDSGDLDTALAHYEEAERLTRAGAVDSAASRFRLLRTAGTLYRTAAESEAALIAHRAALSLAQDEEQPAWEISVLNHLGMLLVQLGEYQEAHWHLERATSLARQTGEAHFLALALHSLGWVELGRGDAAAAAKLLAQALDTEVLSQDLEASILYALAVAKSRLGERAAARQILEPLAERAEAKGLQRSAAEIQYALGSLLLEEGSLDEAADALGSAAELAEKIGDPLRRAAVSSRFGELEIERGRLEAALGHVLEALRLQEAVRSQLVEPELRSTFLARWRGDYERAIEISMRLAAADPAAGHHRRAFALSEAAHARTLTELLTEARVDVRGNLSPELRAAELEADRRLMRVESELAELLPRAAALGAAVDAQVERLRQAREQARRHRDEVEREVRRTHAEYAEIRYPRPPEVEQVQQWLPPRTALLEYALGERSSVLFVVTREELVALPLPPAEEIAARVAEVQRLLRGASGLTRARLAASLAELTGILVAPAADHLAEVDRLVVVPDRDLFYLPFEALEDPFASQLGPGGLLRRWPVTYLPSAAVLPHLERHGTPTWQLDLLAFADPPPVTGPPADGPRDDALPPLGRGDELPSLPGARREAERIADFFPTDRVDLHVGVEARESLLKAPRAPARRLHIASHGVISPTNPEDSYVLLAADESDDGRLYLHEVFDLELDAELVVLSGCETGLGPRLAGEGLIGLVRGFLYAGARELVVSLLPVSDAGTEHLMVELYRLLGAGRFTSDALREAKLARLDDRQEPSLWAPFVVFGAPAPEGPEHVTSRSTLSPE